MDVRLSPEQRALRESAAVLVERLRAQSVHDLDDAERARKLDAAVDCFRMAGAARRRRRRGAMGVGGRGGHRRRGARSRRRRHGVARSDPGGRAATARRRCPRLARSRPSRSLRICRALGGSRCGDASCVAEPAAVAIDAAGSHPRARAARGGGRLPARRDLASGRSPTRGSISRDRSWPFELPASVDAGSVSRLLTDEDVTRWTALGLAVTSADLVGVMDGAIRLACDYVGTQAAIRRRCRVFPGGAAPAGGRAGGDGGLAQRRAARRLGRRRVAGG